MILQALQWAALPKEKEDLECVVYIIVAYNSDYSQFMMATCAVIALSSSTTILKKKLLFQIAYHCSKQAIRSDRQLRSYSTDAWEQGGSAQGMRM